MSIYFSKECVIYEANAGIVKCMYTSARSRREAPMVALRDLTAV